MLTQADDHDFREMVRDELILLDKQYQTLTDRLSEALTPRDANDRRNVVVEIRAGAGGEEAALFVAVLFRMYSNYAEQYGWHAELVDANETELGGYKEVVFVIEGSGAYSRLRYESGVHRVQRVPVTESGGRIHTSTVTVAVLPEAEDVEVSINPNDLEIDTFRATGAGGQHINKTDSAIRITHKPSGIVVTCQDQRSQYKNKDQAMAVLKAKLLEREQNRQTSAIASDRRSQVGTGDRSERIRTYNYHQGRVTDHRIGLTLYRLNSVLEGDLDEIISALMHAARSNQLAGGDRADQD
jgi:peptide chain release factor 1